MKGTLRVLALSAGLLVAGSAAAGDWKVGASYNYTSGKYGGTEETETTSWQTTMSREAGGATYKISIPYVQLEGPASVVSGIGVVGSGGAGAATESGLGDVVTSASYSVYYDASAGHGIDVGGKVKWATGDKDKGLSTGENDIGVLVDFYQQLGDITAFGGFGYTVFGDSDEVQLENAFGYSIGASYKMDSDHSVGVAYDYRQAAAATGEPLKEASAFFSTKITDDIKVQWYLLKGLSDGSPDWGSGMSVGLRF